MITEHLPNRKRLKIIYNETVFTFSKESHLYFQIQNEDLKHAIGFTFSNEGEALSTSYWIDLAGRGTEFTLFQWDIGSWVETEEPVKLNPHGFYR